jgi:hypothetical protein
MAGDRKGPGRPSIEVDENQLLQLGAIHCTMEEIAAVLSMSVDTLQKYSHIIKRGREQGKMSLRRMQWKSAEKGNPVMLIWLGKQMLNQRDFRSDWQDAEAERTRLLETKTEDPLVDPSSPVAMRALLTQAGWADKKDIVDAEVVVSSPAAAPYVSPSSVKEK